MKLTKAQTTRMDKLANEANFYAMLICSFQGGKTGKWRKVKGVPVYWDDLEDVGVRRTPDGRWIVFNEECETQVVWQPLLDFLKDLKK